MNLDVKQVNTVSKLDPDKRLISVQADPGLRLIKHSISERWIQATLTHFYMELAIQNWDNPGLVF